MWPTLCAVGGEGLAVGPQGPPQPSRKVYTSIGTQLLYHIYTPPECPPHPPFSQDLAEDSILFLYYKSRTSSYRYELVKLLLGMANEGALQRASPTAVRDATAGCACFDEWYVRRLFILTRARVRSEVRFANVHTRAQVPRCGAGHRDGFRSGSHRYTLPPWPFPRSFSCASAR